MPSVVATRKRKSPHFKSVDQRRRRMRERVRERKERMAFRVKNEILDFAMNIRLFMLNAEDGELNLETRAILQDVVNTLETMVE